MLKGIASDPTITAGLNKDLDVCRLEKTCAEFESIFISMMLKSMRATITEQGLLGNNNESKMIDSMFDESLAEQIAMGGGMGLGEVLYERLKDK